MAKNQPEHWFILIYGIVDRSLEIREFDGQYEAAADAYTRLEELHKQDDSTEVVLVGADSIETIKRTHSHYFIERDEALFEKVYQGLGAAPARA